MALKRYPLPEIEFTGFYYPQIMADLQRFVQKYCPELTAFHDDEPFVQLLKAWALAHHYSNVRVDIAANNTLLPTSDIRKAVFNQLKLIDYRMQNYTPAAVEIVAKITREFEEYYELVPALSRFSTEKTKTQPKVYFETQEALWIERTNQLGAAFAWRETAGEWHDFTDNANQVISGPWTALDAVAVDDAIYFGHATNMFNKLVFGFDELPGGPAARFIAEYYDGDYDDEMPDEVDDIGGGAIRFRVDVLFGSIDMAGTSVRVRSLRTNNYEDCAVFYSGGSNWIETTSTLGQNGDPYDITEDPSAYVIGLYWHMLTLNQTSDDWDIDDYNGVARIEWELPQTVSKNWKKTTVNNFQGFFVRLRVFDIAAGGAEQPFNRVWLDKGDQFVKFEAIQGVTVSDNPVGDGKSTPFQRVTGTKPGYVEESLKVWVDDIEWTVVDNFLNSTMLSKHAMIDIDKDDRVQAICGDGINGLTYPPGSGNIRMQYRVGAENDGNVGASTVTVNDSGVSFISDITNPRGASGWRQREGETAEDLERVKLEAPALSLRVREVGATRQDIELLAQDWERDDGSKPVARARAVEEMFGPKTVGLVCVGHNGVYLDDDTLTELQEYFNGNPAFEEYGALIVNHQVICVNFTPKQVDVNVDVYGSTQPEVIALLNALLLPDAKVTTTDGVETPYWVWNFSTPANPQAISPSRIASEVFKAVSGRPVTKVEVNTPAVDMPLATNELPVPGNIVVNIYLP